MTADAKDISPMHIAWCAQTVTCATRVDMASYHPRVTRWRNPHSKLPEAVLSTKVLHPYEIRSPSYSTFCVLFPSLSVRDAGDVKREVQVGGHE